MTFKLTCDDVNGSNDVRVPGAVVTDGSMVTVSDATTTEVTDCANVVHSGDVITNVKATEVSDGTGVETKEFSSCVEVVIVVTRSLFTGDVTVEVTGNAGIDDVNASVAKPVLSGRDDSRTNDVDATKFGDAE